MVLATHTVVGVALASLIPEHPIAGFSIAFASHFLLDAIPHWDYKIFSGFINPDINDKLSFKQLLLVISDGIKIFTDLLIGVFIAYLLFSKSGYLVLVAGSVGAILPDILQFLQAKLPLKPIVKLRSFHVSIQKDKRLSLRPYLGSFLQICIIVSIVFLCLYAQTQ